MDLVDSLAADPRVRVRRAGEPKRGARAVVYWMQRAQRGVDNPALDVAIAAGNALGLPVVAFLGVVPWYPNANLRHYRFLVEGIADIARDLERRRVGFVLRAYPDHRLVRLCAEVGAALVVGDENPLREPERWRRRAAELLDVPLLTVDADVVVPVRLLGKEQWAARTIRPRIHKLLPDFLVAPAEPKAKKPFVPPPNLRSLAPGEDLLARFPVERSADPVPSWRGGTAAGLGALERFVSGALTGYDERRNHPELDGTSALSPWLHFGHLGPRAVALAVQRAAAPDVDKDAFLEQLIVRRELATNFVHYNPHYDSLEGCERWALETLERHARDPRPVRYGDDELEQGATGDALWNAAQHQMVDGGWMHNYLRMYWGKKLLEWTASPEHAFALAVRLNDKYELDGRDPNGYAGIAWSIGGKHDRAWGRRPIFGTIRYMSGASTGRKFDSKAYIAKVERLRR